MAPSERAIRSTLPLARALAARGLAITYTAVPDLVPYIEAQGFDHALVHGDLLPRDALARLDAIANPHERELALHEISLGVAADYFEGRISALLRSCRPNLVVADTALFSPLQLASHRVGIPCLQISTTWLPGNIHSAPLSSYLEPGSDSLSLRAARWHSSCLNARMAGVPCAQLTSAAMDRYLAAFGYPADRLSLASEFYPTLNLFPAVTCAPAALDWPHETRITDYLALPYEQAPRVTLTDRVQRFLNPSKPLIYTCLGKAAHRYPHASRLYCAVIEALRLRLDCQALVAIGRHDSRSHVLPDLPSNVLLEPEVPQDGLLPRASIFVSNVSFDSMHAAITYGTPMIAVPQDFDQPGNAARILHHGLGIRLQPELVDAVTVGMAIDRMRADMSQFRDRLHHMQARCKAETDPAASVARILSLARPGQHGPPAQANTTKDTPADRIWQFADRERADGPRHHTFATALAAATGNYLVRFDIRSSKVLWRLDVSEALLRYARWCANAVLELDEAKTPARAAHFRQYIRAEPGSSTAAAARQTDSHDAHEVFIAASKHWHHGYGAIAMALRGDPYKAAHLAQLESLAVLAREAVGTAAGTAAGAVLFERSYQTLQTRFARRLGQEITASITAAQLPC